MGRGGGRSGGSHHRSSGGSHSRSFGGSHSRTSRGGGSHRTSHAGSSIHVGPRVSYHYGPRMTHHYYGNGGYNYYDYGAYRKHRLSATVITIVFIIIIIYIIIGALVFGSNVAKSTIEREKLEPYASFSRMCIDDDADWITDDRTLLRGMESFYKKTGVQPALAIYEDINGQKYLPDSEIEDFMYDKYDELIGHERGILLLFCEYEPSDYYAYYMAGEDVQTVMDSEACDILIDYVHDLYTNDNYSDEEYFSAVFDKTGTRIMTVTPTIASKMQYIVLGFVATAFMLTIIIVVKMKHERDAKKAEETERILNSPIDRI